MGYALVFPGQGSQKTEMGKEIFEASEAARNIFAEISDALGRDVAKLCFEADEESLRQTDATQVALYSVSVATAKALQEKACCVPPPVAMAGHSVGEYAALAISGVFSITDGAKLVRKRGELMARAGKLRKGAMAAVLGLDENVIGDIAKRSSTQNSVVVVANFNCPGQTVISGDAAAVERACIKLKEAGAKRCLPLSVSGAFHSPLMNEAAEAMGEALKEIALLKPRIPVISNVTAEPGDDWPILLEKQLYSPVRWSESVRKMRAMGADLFIESGSGEVLSGLLKRIDPAANGISVANAENLEEAVRAIESS